jgi:formylglycine-generating enzyme required for sulfatase activity
LAESNFAAAGGSEQRYYPWSTSIDGGTIDATYASYKEDPPRMCNGDGVDGCAMEDLIFVGTRPKGNGRWGHADMAGNVWEWALDGDDTMPLPCSDCAAGMLTNRRSVRGGSYQDIPFALATERHVAEVIFSAEEYNGARCARD